MSTNERGDLSKKAGVELANSMVPQNEKISHKSRDCLETKDQIYPTGHLKYGKETRKLSGKDVF